MTCNCIGWSVGYSREGDATVFLMVRGKQAGTEMDAINFANSTAEGEELRRTGWMQSIIYEVK